MEEKDPIWTFTGSEGETLPLSKIMGKKIVSVTITYHPKKEKVKTTGLKRFCRILIGKKNWISLTKNANNQKSKEDILLTAEKKAIEAKAKIAKINIILTKPTARLSKKIEAL